MATTSVLKLVIDDKEYEASLKNAKAGMQDLQQSLQAAGKTFSDVDGKVVEYARAIGQMDATSKTAKGRIGEMSQAFIELKTQYINMTDAEKQSPLGQAMAQSLEELKGRTIDAKQQLADLNKELEVNSGDAKESSGILDQLAGKFTINVDAIKLFNLGLKAANAALNVAKDAFFASEANVDEWGRTMQAAESLYAGFVTSLNNSDFSGFLSRIDDIVKAAKEAYNELDALGTLKTIQAPGMSAQQTENVRMRTMLMTGHWISSPGKVAPHGLKDGDLLTPGMIRAIERQLKNGTNSIVSLTKNEINQSNKAINAYYNSLAKQNGMTVAEFRKGTSSKSEWDARQKGYQDYLDWNRKAAAEYARQGGRGTVDFDKNNPYVSFKKWETFRVDKMDENSYNDLVGHIIQRDQQISQMYSTMGQAYRTINRAEGVTVKGILNPGGGGGGKGRKDVTWAADSIKAQEMLVNELRKQWNEAAGDVRNEYLAQLVDAEKKLKEMNDEQAMLRENLQGRMLLKADSISTTGLSNVGGIGTYENAMEQVGKKFEIKIPLQLDEDAMNSVGEQIKSNLSNIISERASETKRIISGLVQVSSGLQQMGVELPEGVQTLFNMVNGLMTVLEGVNTITGGALFGALTANTFALGALTSAIWANTATSLIPGFAGSGIVPHAANGYYVPGNNFSGDTTPILANAGELVLNKAAQGNLASQLSGNNFGGANLVARLRGRDILISVERTLQSKGKGQLLTFK